MSDPIQVTTQQPTLLNISANQGFTAALRLVVEFAAFLTDGAKDQLVREIGKCYFPTKTDWTP